MLTSHAAPAAAVEEAFPGHIEMQLAKAGDQRWTAVCRWDALASMQAAPPGHPASRIPEAAFSPAKGISVGYAKVVDA